MPQRECILWAERFDGGLEDIFDLQDQVTARFVGEIAPKLEQMNSVAICGCKRTMMAA